MIPISSKNAILLPKYEKWLPGDSADVHLGKALAAGDVRGFLRTPGLVCRYD